MQTPFVRDQWHAIRSARTLCFVMVTLLSSLSVGAFAHAREPPPEESILVWKLQAKLSMSQAEVDSLTDFIATEVEKASGRKVVSESELQSIIRREQARAACGIGASAECIAEIGAALGAGEVVQGNLGEVGGVWFLNIARIAVKRAETVKRVTVKSNESLESVVKQIPKAVAELFGAAQVPTEAHRDTRPLPWLLVGVSGAALVSAAVLHGVNAQMTVGDATPTFVGAVGCYALSAAMLSWAVVEFTRPEFDLRTPSAGSANGAATLDVFPLIGIASLGVAGSW